MKTVKCKDFQKNLDYYMFDVSNNRSRYLIECDNFRAVFMSYEEYKEITDFINKVNPKKED